MNTKHTPTPWFFEFDELGGYDSRSSAYHILDHDRNDEICKIDTSEYRQVHDWDLCHAECETAKANAAFICRAVNSHDALVLACENALQDFQSGKANLATYEYLRAALAAAKRGDDNE